MRHINKYHYYNVFEVPFFQQLAYRKIPANRVDTILHDHKSCKPSQIQSIAMANLAINTDKNHEH